MPAASKVCLYVAPDASVAAVEPACVERHGVRRVALVRPGDLLADLGRQRGRVEREVLDRHGCAGPPAVPRPAERGRRCRRGRRWLVGAVVGAAVAAPDEQAATASARTTNRAAGLRERASSGSWVLLRSFVRGGRSPHKCRPGAGLPDGYAASVSRRFSPASRPVPRRYGSAMDTWRERLGPPWYGVDAEPACGLEIHETRVDAWGGSRARRPRRRGRRVRSGSTRTRSSTGSGPIRWPGDPAAFAARLEPRSRLFEARGRQPYVWLPPAVASPAGASPSGFARGRLHRPRGRRAGDGPDARPAWDARPAAVRRGGRAPPRARLAPGRSGRRPPRPPGSSAEAFAVSADRGDGARAQEILSGPRRPGDRRPARPDRRRAGGGRPAARWG